MGSESPFRHRLSEHLGPIAKTLRRRVAGIPRAVWLITALWLSLLLGASLVWPMLFGYDESQHVDMSYVYSAHPFHFYGPGQLVETRADSRTQAAAPKYPIGVFLFGMPNLYGTQPLPRDKRPSFAELGGTSPVAGTPPNQMVQHPPLYYWVEAAILRVPGVSHLAWDLQVWIMRLVSVIMMLPLPILCWATTRRLLAGERSPPDAPSGIASQAPILAAVIPLTIPNLIRDGSAVTNDTLLILTTSVLLYLLSRVLTGDLSLRTALGVAVSLAAALFTKGLALVLPPVVLVAYLIGACRYHERLSERWRAVWAPLIVAGIGAAAGSLWWIRNIVDYGTVQTNGTGPGYQRIQFGPPDNHGTIAHFLPVFVTNFVERIWGGIGLADTPSIGPFIEYGWFFVVLIAVVAALRNSRREAGPVGLRDPFLGERPDRDRGRLWLVGRLQTLVDDLAGRSGQVPVPVARDHRPPGRHRALPNAATASPDHGGPSSPHRGPDHQCGRLDSDPSLGLWPARNGSVRRLATFHRLPPKVVSGAGRNHARSGSGPADPAEPSRRRRCDLRCSSPGSTAPPHAPDGDRFTLAEPTLRRVECRHARSPLSPAVRVS